MERLFARRRNWFILLIIIIVTILSLFSIDIGDKFDRLLKAANKQLIPVRFGLDAGIFDYMSDFSYILTNVGNKSIFEIETQVYIPFGYSIKSGNCLQFLCLEKRLKSECSTVFRDWLKIALTYNLSSVSIYCIMIDTFF